MFWMAPMNAYRTRDKRPENNRRPWREFEARLLSKYEARDVLMENDFAGM